MSRSALFIVDATNGQGHLVRCRALASELAGRGWHCSMMPKRPSGWIGDVVIVDGLEFYDGLEAVHDWPGMKVVSIRDTPHAPTYGADLIVMGSAGFHNSDRAATESYPTRYLEGPNYSLLRREFRDQREIERGMRMVKIGTFDVRSVDGLPAREMARKMADAYVVVTYAGMRAMEAACVGVGATTLESKLVLHARNEGEELNKRGLEAGAVVDGLGCQRVAAAIEELVL